MESNPFPSQSVQQFVGFSIIYRAHAQNLMKSGDPLSIPVLPRILDELRRYQGDKAPKKGDLIFPGVKTFAKAWNRVRGRAGFTYMDHEGKSQYTLRFHGLRHCFQQLCEDEAKIAERVCRKLMAHKPDSRDSHRATYENVSGDELQEAIDTLDVYLRKSDDQVSGIVA